MRNLYLDITTYDLVVTDSFNLRFTANLGEFVSQKIENVLSVFEGEWFLDYTLGIPYFTRILLKHADIDDVNNIFLTAISGIDEIQEVLEFDTIFDTILRKYSVDFKVLASEDGEAEEVITGGRTI